MGFRRVLFRSLATGFDYRVHHCFSKVFPDCQEDDAGKVGNFSACSWTGQRIFPLSPEFPANTTFARLTVMAVDSSMPSFVDAAANAL